MEIVTSQSATTSVFITGAMTGVGRATAKILLAAGHRVTGAVSSSSDGAILRADGVLPAYPDLNRAGELRSAIAANDAKVVVHLAPQAANQPPQLGFSYDLALADEVGRVIEAAKDAGVEYVLFTSFAFMDADTHNEEAEELVAPLQAAVRKAEAAALSGDVPASVLRLGYLYGAHSPALTDLRASLKLGRSAPAGSDHGRSAWLHDSDAARAIVAALNARPVGQTLTVADDAPASPAAFLRYFAESQGLVVSEKMSPIARALANKTQLALQELHYHGSSAEAKSALGWSPRFSSFQQGIDDILLTWRASEPIVS